jgi:hypothetical protein
LIPSLMANSRRVIPSSPTASIAHTLFSRSPAIWPHQIGETCVSVVDWRSSGCSGRGGAPIQSYYAEEIAGLARDQMDLCVGALPSEIAIGAGDTRRRLVAPAVILEPLRGKIERPFLICAVYVLPSTSGAASGAWSIEPWRILAADVALA